MDNKYQPISLKMRNTLSQIKTFDLNLANKPAEIKKMLTPYHKFTYYNITSPSKSPCTIPC